MITIQAVGTKLFKLTITKRWKWAEMTDNYGQPHARIAYLKHSKNNLCWNLATPEEIERAELGGVDDDDILVRLPKDGPVSNKNQRSLLTRLAVPKKATPFSGDCIAEQGRKIRQIYGLDAFSIP